MATPDRARVRHPSARSTQAISVLGLTLVGTVGMLIAVASFEQRPLPGDLAVSRLVHGLLASDSLAGRALAHTDRLVWTAMMVAIVTLTLRRHIAAAVWLGLGVASSYMLGEVVLKPLLARPRPAAGLVSFSQVSDGYGFPSTTTLMAVVLGGLLINFVVQQARHAAAPVHGQPAGFPVLIGAIALIGLTSVSRICTGEHWASDVLGRWLVGSCWTLGLIVLYAWWMRRREAH